MQPLTKAMWSISAGVLAGVVVVALGTDSVVGELLMLNGEETTSDTYDGRIDDLGVLTAISARAADLPDPGRSFGPRDCRSDLNGDRVVNTEDLLILLQDWGVCPSIVQINEIRIRQVGADDDDYAELKGLPGTPLDRLTYIAIGPGGTISSVVPLVAATIPDDGHFLIARDEVFPGRSCAAVPDLTISGLQFEANVNVTHMLVDEFTGSMGQDLDSENDCVLDVMPWTSVVDSIALEVADPSGQCIYAPTEVGPCEEPGQMNPAHVYRCEDSGTWTCGLVGECNPFETPGVLNSDCPL